MGQRPTPGETTLQEIEAFLYHMEKYKPGSTVMITGGEPTMSPNLGRVAREIGARGFKSFLLTNGFKLVEPAWFDYIILDDHGINKSEIENWKRGLRDTDVWWKVRNKTMHIDTLNAKYLNITKGARCSSWLDPLTLWRDVVYPCCLMMCVEWWHYTDEITKALRASGWTVENPSLVSTIKNWRETLPSEFYRFCSLKCWRDSEKVIWVPIGAERV
jgi:organic radical activating enzyme